MKLLRVKASGFKGCCDDFTIDMTAKSKKTSEDREYELQEVADRLFTYNVAAFVGKNASGKTTALELLDCCYSILSDFRLEDKHYSYDNVALEITFFHNDLVFRYTTKLCSDSTLGNKAVFADQHLYQKKYYKTHATSVCEDAGFEELTDCGELPEDTSIVFFALKQRQTRAVYFDSDGKGPDTYSLIFKAMKNYGISVQVLSRVIGIFDAQIREIQMVDEHNFKVLYADKKRVISDKELLWLLSSGTTKGMLLYIMAVASLQNGFDLVVDEVENHFHKTLVENLISLYKDKAVNRNHASLLFSTHYCEVLDLFNRQDNIWICQTGEKIHIRNMYEDYNVRPELLKSRQFYGDAFQTAVNYERLMDLKRVLMQ